MIQRMHTVGRAAYRAISLLCAVVAAALFGVSRPAEAQVAGAAAEEAELPHAFFTHMGLPEGVGVFNLRTLGLATRAGGETKADFAFHLETGITSRIGLHVRNDQFRENSFTEAMFQFAAFVSENGMSGFAPLIEFEVPTRSAPAAASTRWSDLPRRLQAGAPRSIRCSTTTHARMESTAASRSCSGLANGSFPSSRFSGRGRGASRPW